MKKIFNKKAMASWIWILIILVIVALGILIYVLLNGNGGGTSPNLPNLTSGNSAPNLQPPALPS